MPTRAKVFGGRIIAPMRVLDDYEIRINGAVIESVCPRDESSDCGCELFDARGGWITPGFIDLHVHGGGGHDFMDATTDAFHSAARMHALHGTTTLLPTSLASSTPDLLDIMNYPPH
ncbi:hypothetical protein AGMMS49992_20440 [Clostridia bacterium]|nr:hypothetical protein AGMMS49992_20440 [Clostridia bacterium]